MNFEWTMAKELGYEPKTTFWNDFSIADVYGIDAIKDTFKRAFGEWKTDYIYLTELVMVLNHKAWQHYERDNSLAELYDELWREADVYAVENLRGDELIYFLVTTD